MLEGLTCGRFYLLLIQTSSFYGSLVLVLLRVVIMFFIRIDLIRSGLFLFIFMMLFVGGLLVLLVRLTCVIRQEQSGILAVAGTIIILLITISMLRLSYREIVCGVNPLLSWLELNVLVALILSFLLSLSLLVIRWALLSYKGITRRACSYGVQHSFFSRNGFEE